ncbi:ZN574 protein, partial [Xiphorhynchus elegans]|nr:ZN574 protein [Xiphorhynchus elegans]
LFQSQELWLAHRQAHRHGPPPRVDLEHSYRKPHELGGVGDGPEPPEPPVAAPEDPSSSSSPSPALQLLLYECGECLQLFQSPKDFLEHQ